MSRTYRDGHKIRLNRWWAKWYNEFHSYNWQSWPRDAIRELEELGGWIRGTKNSYRTEWRRANHRRERALIHMSLKHGGLYWYYRRKRGDGYSD